METVVVRGSDGGLESIGEKRWRKPNVVYRKTLPLPLGVKSL